MNHKYACRNFLLFMGKKMKIAYAYKFKTASIYTAKSHTLNSYRHGPWKSIETAYAIQKLIKLQNKT